MPLGSPPNLPVSKPPVMKSKKPNLASASTPETKTAKTHWPNAQKIDILDWENLIADLLGQLEKFIQDQLNW
jgi:hypothetical protein